MLPVKISGSSIASSLLCFCNAVNSLLVSSSIISLLQRLHCIHDEHSAVGNEGLITGFCVCG